MPKCDVSPNQFRSYVVALGANIYSEQRPPLQTWSNFDTNMDK